MKKLEDYVRSIPDFPEPGIIFRDITSILQDADGLRLAIDSMQELLKGVDFDVIVGAESRGFVFGAPIAYNLHKPFVLIRKKGKLPCETVSKEYDLEYGSAEIEMHKDSIKPGQKVVLVDDLIATGGTIQAAAELVESLGGQVVKILFLMELKGLKGRERLKKYDVDYMLTHTPLPLCEECGTLIHPGVALKGEILDNLIAAGKAVPMIVVMPNGNAALPSAPGEGPDGLYQPITRPPKSMEGSYEASFLEIVRFVDSHYRTVRKAEGRAVAGLSMGGFHSFHISKQYPDTFGYVGLFSAAVRQLEDGTGVYADFDRKIARQFADGVELYYIAIGKDDFLYEENVRLRSYLDSHGYPYEYHESDGGHIWRNWRIYLTDFLQKIF